MARPSENADSWAGRLALLCGSLAVSLILIEVGLRGYHAAKQWLELRRLPPVAERALVPSEDPELVYEFNPGWSRGEFHINEHGMADDPVALEKPPGRTRIAIVGDSISANFDLLPREVTYPTLLERDARVETLNFAVNGYSILQSLRMAQIRVPAFAPDVLLVQLCLNDPSPSVSAYTPLPPSLPLRTLGFVSRRLDPHRAFAREYVEQLYDAPGWARVRRGLEGFAAIAREGLPTLVVLFPYFQAEAYESWGFQRLHERYRQEAARAGLEWLDLYPALAAAGAVRAGAPEPLHPDAGGHAVAARVIGGELAERGWLAPGRPASRGELR